MTLTILQHLLAHWLTTIIIYPILSVYKTANSANNLFFFYYIDNEGSKLLQNVSKQLPINVPSYCKRF